MSFDYKELIGKLIEENSNLKKQLEELVLKVPSKYLTNSAEFNGETHPDDTEEQKYIYESPDGGETIYRRKFGDYDTPREQLDSDGNPLPTQMELF